MSDKNIEAQLLSHEVEIASDLPFRKWLYAWLLDPYLPGNYQKGIDKWIGILIVANLFALVFEHVPAIYEPNQIWFHYFDVVSVIIFSIEYVTRLYLAPEDEEFKNVNFEKVPGLRPAFTKDGSVTAANASTMNDGAAAVMVMSDTKAKALGLTPLARFVSSGVSSLNPEIMGLGPVEACRQAMKRAGMSINDIDLVEINEAFAAQVLPSAKHLGISMDKLNINGGAIALGHPFGMTGARIMTTLIHGLQASNKNVGMETMCVGGGQGLSMIIERMS